MSSEKGGAKYVYGVCTNTDKDGSGEPCPVCQSQQKVKLSSRREFICPTCGEPLTKVSTPKPPVGLLIGLGAAVVVIVVAIVIYLLLANKGDANEAQDEQIEATEQTVEAQPEDVIDVEQPIEEAIEEPEQPAEEPQKPAEEVKAKPEKTAEAQPAAKTATETKTNKTTTAAAVNPAYGKYSGERKNGKAHGFGDLVFTTTKLVADGVYAERGYKIRNGRYINGKLQSGTLYDADGIKVCFVDANNYISW